MESIREFKFGDICTYVNYDNGKIVNILEENLIHKNKVFEINNFHEKPPKMAKDYSKVQICLNVTNNCNLRCSYCFNPNKTPKNVDLDKSKKFIDLIMNQTPNAEKYYIDLSGSGEPMLNFCTINELAQYSIEKSDQFKKDVIPMLVSNGTLLTKEKVQTLQKNKVLFGVSLDGLKKHHDKYRVDIKGQGTYKQIMKNVTNIEHRDYVGVAVSLADGNQNLVKMIKHLDKYFSTISIRFIRSYGGCSYSDKDVKKIKHNYTKLMWYLLDKAHQNDCRLLFKILNGDDYFGKYLIRIMCNAKIESRCDAAYGRFSLGLDDHIYVCSAAINNQSLIIGTLEEGLDNEKIKRTTTKREQCNQCEAVNICGGECLVTLAEKGGIDKNMCILKRHLFELGLFFCASIELKNPSLYQEIVSFVSGVNNRNHYDAEFKSIVEYYKEHYSYTELKDIKDNNPSFYAELLKQAN